MLQNLRKMYIYTAVAVLLLASGFFSSAAGECQKEGKTCNKTVFQRCCGELLCDLQTFGRGKCVKCLPEKSFCGKDGECCSGHCDWLKCTAN